MVMLDKSSDYRELSDDRLGVMVVIRFIGGDDGSMFDESHCRCLIHHGDAR